MNLNAVQNRLNTTDLGKAFGPSLESPGFPVVYSSGYDIDFFRIAPNLPLVPGRRREVFESLQAEFSFRQADCVKPVPASYKDLQAVHSPEYLLAVRRPEYLARLLAIPAVRTLSPIQVERKILLPLRRGAGGTVTAVERALECGWAINLSGGFHHAHARRGGGFCVFADIPLAVRHYLKEHPRGRVLIVDLDAHHGDGVYSTVGYDDRVRILDLFNKNIFPRVRRFAESSRHQMHPLSSSISEKDYNLLAQVGLEKAILEHRPTLMLYNAGADVFKNDKLGGFSISEDGIISRDRMVFSRALDGQIPVAVVSGGMYADDGARIVARSFAGLIRTGACLSPSPGE